MTTARDILLKILEAIDYRDSREAFVDEFLRNIRLQSVVNLIQSLPAEKQTAVNQQLSHHQNVPEKIASLLKDYFSQQELDQALETAAKQAVTEYIQAITPTLSLNQKEKLLRVMEEVGQVPQA
jgi:hypothetical protein